MSELSCPEASVVSQVPSRSVALSDLLGEIIGIIGVVLCSLLLSVVILTLGRSIAAARRRKRRERVHDTLRAGLLDRLYSPGDSEWDAWVRRLSRVERSVLESVLDSTLREVEGSDAETLRELSVALGIPARARRNLSSGRESVRLQALTWLTLLRDPTDEILDRSYEPSTTAERVAVARLVYAADQPDAEYGLSILLEDANEPFSVFGVDTLYRLAERDVETFLDRVAASASTWDSDLLAQVLLVVRSVGTPAEPDRLKWIVDQLDHPDGSVRAAAARTLGTVGWNARIRANTPLKRIIHDGDPTVRSSVYQMLGEWRTEKARTTILSALAEEADDRALVAAARALHTGNDTLAISALPPRARPAFEWVREIHEYERRARTGQNVAASTSTAR
ncbi:HEAT repeat domain-containing protein [Halobaculum sp. EA56]|uniref:HEAT repeat domain-containing protein n=1 Tax=Halobaculum sp. EA56 TaxID=3421648 RepID=UPI003EBE1A28